MENIKWLLDSEPYVEYATRINILKQNKNELQELRKNVLSDYRIKKYLDEVAAFNSVVITTHKNPELPIHKLHFLFDIGLDTDVPQIKSAIERILENKDENGMYKTITNIPVSIGGTGENSMAWCLCDAPLMLAALVRAGVSYEENIKAGVEYISGMLRENGFPCAVSKELSKFRGPGRKSDCCPYANLAVLRLLSLLPDYKDSNIAKSCINVIQSLWENSKDMHPYMFFMGNDFRKLKAPALWYDIVSVTECLSKFETAKTDYRYQSMLEIISKKADENHRFTPESIYLKCKDWDFGQKKDPSPWLTYLCLKIINENTNTN